MKTARERAVLIVHEAMGNNFTRETFEVMARDKSETGEIIRKWITACENGIEADRKDVAVARAPS